MFKVPDWEADVPKTNVVFTKKATKKQSKYESVTANSTHNLIRNAQDITEDEQNESKSIFTYGNINNAKKKPKKRKNKNDIEDIFMKAHEGFKIDELLVNTKKKKLNKIYKKDDCEELLFGVEAKETKSPVLKKSKNNNNKQKLKSGHTNGTVENNVNKSPTKRKHGDDDNEEINNIIVNAKKIKLNDSDASENKNVKRNVFKNNKKANESNIVKNKVRDNEKNTNNHVSEEKETRNDLKKKEKFKKLLEQNNRTPINVTGNNLRERMMERLKAAQFRYLNEKLYTTTGNEAQQIFLSDPAAFRTYHQGYQLQVKKWPVNPLDVIVKQIHKLPKHYVIADMGCGEAALSKRVSQKVHSFDLVASAPGVVACDMARTPLLKESTDVVVYCLALMGTELTQYLVEANRVLKPSGQLLIAEVESRFDDVNNFIKEVERLGFKLKNVDKQHSVFFFLHFVKVKEPPVKKGKWPVLSLKPCLYKKR